MAIDVQGEFRRPLPLILASIAVLGWLVAGYSMWRASAESTEAAAQIRQLETKVAAGQAALEKAARDGADAAKALQAALDKANHDLAATQAKVAEAQSAIEKAGHERDDALTRLRAAQQDTAQSQAKVGDLQAALDKAHEDQGNVAKQLDAARQQVTETQARLTAAEQELAARATPATSNQAPATSDTNAPPR